MCILKYHSLGKTRRISSFSFTVIEEIFLEIRERYEGGDIIEQDACNDEINQVDVRMLTQASQRRPLKIFQPVQAINPVQEEGMSGSVPITS